ncbi:hypothetical protein AN396_14105 [Candidatus Epulonipiscium fishelsonii]|uniref:Uncharacterized protein n=1 Tax=Candidatus Epulonipiscium fishelsonii TaxID=77094 RepID=A0ACC8XG79_9FIRM|nr:hypothetical protein AN396_14105 [Epulopiscium sp. SCG-B11WGA-EpuloA1]
MKIINNIPALQGLNSFHYNNGLLNASAQKLSSGLRITKSADDVSGYAISNKIRTQVQGTKQANNNAMDGIAIVQTAEGSLEEVHDMLQRMRELAIQSANNTNVSIDRSQIQKEMDHLIAEINTITGNSEFNTMPLLKGGKPLAEAPFIVELKRTVDENGDEISDLTNNPRLARLDEYAQYKVQILNSATAEPGSGFTLDGVVFEYYDSDEGLYKGSAQPIDIKKARPDGSTSDVLHMYNITPGFKNFVFSEEGGEFKLTAKEKGSAGNYMVAHMGGTPTNNIKTQIGANAHQLLDLKLDAISSTTLGLMAPTGTPGYKEASNGGKPVSLPSYGGTPVTLPLNNTEMSPSSFKFENDESNNAVNFASAVPLTSSNIEYSGLNVMDDDSIQFSIQAIDKAIAKVSKARSYIGAAQNRLQYTIEDLDVTEETMTETFSKIRDTDMAAEMTEFTRTDVLTQSAVSMLAKANELPSLVMQLLQN